MSDLNERICIIGGGPAGLAAAISAYDNGVKDVLIFEREETLNALGLNGTLCTRNATTVLKDSKVLPLYNKYFDIDALIFTDIKSRFVTLRNRKTGKQVKVDFPNCDYFLLWHKPNSPYMCLEPWDGIQDLADSSFDITEKEGIIALEKGKVYNHTHSINILS